MVNYKKYIEWDVSSWSECLTFWNNNTSIDFEKSKCLELGSRKGGLSLWLAEKGAHVICSDIYNPEKKAVTFHSQYKFQGKIDYMALNATELPFENEFDIIVFKSILGGIARKNKNELKLTVINEAYKSLKKGGYLLFAENLISSGFHQYFRKKFTKWGNEWNYLQLDEIHTLFHNYSSIRYKTKGLLGAFGRTEFQRNLLAYFDKVIFNKIVPDNKKYIVYGIAVK